MIYWLDNKKHKEITPKIFFLLIISEDSSQYENTRPTFRLCPLNLSRKKSIRSSCIKQSKYLPQKYSPSSIILIRYTKRINVMNGWITIFFMNWWFPDENADYKTPSCQFHQYLSNCVLNVYKFWYQMIFFKDNRNSEMSPVENCLEKILIIFSIFQFFKNF